MKFMHLAACALAFSVAAAAPASAGPIKSEKDFLAKIAGKKLVASDHWVLATADGKLQGVSPKGEKIVGAWAWHKRFYCRNVYIGKKQLPQNCLTVTTNGNTVTFTRDQGKGRSITYSF